MSTSFDTQGWMARLRATLERLAAPAGDQVAYLEALGTGEVADELALEFDDAFRPLEPALRDEPGTGQLLETLKALDRALTADSLGWSVQEIREQADWTGVRVLAAKALLAMPGET